MRTTAAAAEMRTAAAASAADVATATAEALGEARGRHGQNQRQRCGGTQYFQTCHDQTPFPESKSFERAGVPGITPVCASGADFHIGAVPGMNGSRPICGEGRPLFARSPFAPAELDI
jgi:hypothetical protein